MSRPCSCGGSNENCNICYGRGFVEGGYAPASPRRAKTIKQAKKPTASNTLFHSTSSSLTTLVRMDSCPLCNARVRANRLQKHMSKKCPLRPGQSTTPVRGAQVKCPVCPFKGSTNDFTRHFALEHGTKGRLRRRIQVPVVCVAVSSRPIAVGKVAKKNKKNENTRYSTENISQESLRHKGTVEAEAPPWRNNLDATKDYGYPAREAGRYGSHPSHDGFDDESKP